MSKDPLVHFRQMDTSHRAAGERDYATCNFTAPLWKTNRLLKAELRRIGVESAIVELDAPAESILADGTGLKARRSTWSPRVRLLFERPGVGPLQFMSDTYADWTDNLRGIAKTLEALRAVDRYGAVKHRQQYDGFKALPPAGGGVTATGGSAETMTVERAAEIIEKAARVGSHNLGDLQHYAGKPAGSTPGDTLRRVVRTAKRNTHPDHGGDADDFALVNRAAGVLGV